MRNRARESRPATHEIFPRLSVEAAFDRVSLCMISIFFFGGGGGTFY